VLPISSVQAATCYALRMQHPPMKDRPTRPSELVALSVRPPGAASASESSSRLAKVEEDGDSPLNGSSRFCLGAVWRMKESNS